jgi:hypothetical protein
VLGVLSLALTLVFAPYAPPGELALFFGVTVFVFHAWGFQRRISDRNGDLMTLREGFALT